MAAVSRAGLAIAATLAAGAVRAESGTWHDPALIAGFGAGIFCIVDPARTDEMVGDTIKGTVEFFSNEAPRLARETRTVPALERIYFGVEGRPTPPSADAVEITVTHPPLGWQGAVTETWQATDGGGRFFHGYYLGLSDGDPTGRWTISGTRAGVPLWRAEFEVVDPATGEVDPCRDTPVS